MKRGWVLDDCPGCSSRKRDYQPYCGGCKRSHHAAAQREGWLNQQEARRRVLQEIAQWSQDLSDDEMIWSWLDVDCKEYASYTEADRDEMKKAMTWVIKHLTGLAGQQARRRGVSDV